MIGPIAAVLTACALTMSTPAAAAHDPEPPAPLCDAASFCISHSTVLICMTKDACPVTTTPRTP